MTRKSVKGSVKFTKMSSPDAGFPISRFNFKCTAVPVSSEPMRRNQGVSLDLALSYKEDYILATEVVGLDQPIVPSNFCTERSSPALFPAGRKEAGAKKNQQISTPNHCPSITQDYEALEEFEE